MDVWCTGMQVFLWLIGMTWLFSIGLARAGGGDFNMNTTLNATVNVSSTVIIEK